MDKTFEQQDQLKMVVASTTDRKEKISNGDHKDEDSKTRDQQDPLQMAAIPTTADQKGKIDNSDKKEEKIGMTCHQCRQKIKGLSAHCTNKKKKKPCPNKFCYKCLINRYGEHVDEKSALKDWNCPKCRGICNCSVCMKRRGQQPTGKLVHTAKLNWCSSVSDEGTNNKDAFKYEPSDGSSSKAERENPVGTNSYLNSLPVSSIRNEKKKKRKHEESNDIEEISLPQGTELTTVAGNNLPQEDVGHALQFLEFCTVFKEILDLKEREPENILTELIRGGNGCRGNQSPVIRFHIVLLSMIYMDLEIDGQYSWLNAVKNFVSRSGVLFGNLKLEDLNFEEEEYESLGSSSRLRLLNFLCDEALCTGKLRSLIDDRNLNVKESNEKVIAAKQKEKQLKLKLQDEVAKAVCAKNGVHLSTFEHEAVVSEIKNEVALAHSEVLEAINMATYEEQRCKDAKTIPLYSDINGHRYWNLKGFTDDSSIFLEDVGNWDGFVCSEKWFTIDAEQAKELEKRIGSLRESR